MSGVSVTDGIKSKVDNFLYFFEIFKVINARPALEKVAMKNIFVKRIGVSLKGSSGKYIEKWMYKAIIKGIMAHKICLKLIFFR